MNHTRAFTLLGALIGLVAPAGLLVYGVVRGGLPDPLSTFAILAAGGVTLLAAAGAMVGRREDILEERNEELRLLSDQLQRQSITDALTEIPNRRLFDYELAREVARALRYKLPLSLIMVDLDHFKKLNDNHGHPAGDQVLRAVAGALRNECRQGDIVCRYGGEEFAAILPQTSARDGAQWAQRVCEAFRDLVVDTVAGPLQITGSFGVAEIQRSGGSGDALTRDADLALYRAKNQGRNRVVADLRNTSSIPAAPEQATALSRTATKKKNM